MVIVKRGTSDYCQTCDEKFRYPLCQAKRTAKIRVITAIATLSATPTCVQYPGGTTAGSRFLTTWGNCRAEIRAIAAPSSSKRTPNPSETPRCDPDSGR